MISRLQTQLWVQNEKKYHVEPKPEYIQEVGLGAIGIKGSGGLWTSTYLGEEKGSDWIEWCLGAEFLIPSDGIWKGYLLEPKEDLRIYIIDSLKDMHELFDAYGYELYPGSDMEGIDYVKVSEDYDAVHLTENGQIITRNMGFSFFKQEELKPEWAAKLMRSFYGWDCESTFHLRWNFEKVTPIELKIENIPYDFPFEIKSTKGTE